MTVSIFQFIMLSHQEITEESFKKLWIFVNSFLQIVVICTNQSIPKIPGIFSKNIVVYIKSQRAEIFDCKNSGCSCIFLSKRMNLPEAGNKERNMLYNLFHT